jgi:hypothetical protein
MNQTFYQFKHPIIGDIHFDFDDRKKCVRLHCNWPYDLGVNEWINLDNEFSALNFSRGIRALNRRKRATVAGLHGGRIRFKLLSRERIEFDVETDGRNNYQEFRYEIPARVSDLLFRFPKHSMN